MVVYGWRGRVLSGAQIQDMECANCGKNMYTTFGILQYFHIFWIPLFPYSRKPGMECENCKHTQVGKEIRDPVRGKIKDAVFTMGRTAPMFAGLVLIAAAAAFIAFTGWQNQEQERLYLANPEVGDTYIVKVSKIFEGGDPEYDFVLMQIESVNGDQVGFKVSATQYNLAKGPKEDMRTGKADDPDYYMDGIQTFSLDELASIEDNRGIRSIYRRGE